jgi:hypothetical protein
MSSSSKPLEMSPEPVSDANEPPWVRAEDPTIPADYAASLACSFASCGDRLLFYILY